MSIEAAHRDVVVSLREVSKQFGDIRAVDRVTLEVHRGELLALVGPSGCGKTTLLRLIAGLETPDEGVVEIDGRCVAGPGIWVTPEARRVGLVFQDYALFPHMTVAENITFGLHRWPSRERRDRLAELLERLRLTALADRYPHELSGGEQQRVALARALAPRPEVVLLDEPFSNLDVNLRVQVREEVREVLRAVEATVIFVTHDQEEALFMGDRVAVLRAGRLEQVGTPEDVFHRPRTRFVAEFMGYTVFLPARVVGNQLMTELGAFEQHVPLPEGAEVEILVRPDDVTFTPDPDGNARVVDRRFQGMHYLYRVELPSGRRVYCLAPHTFVCPVGTRVQVTLQPGHTLGCFVDGRALYPGKQGQRAKHRVTS